MRTSALVETDEGKNILIDIGPDFREQMLREKVSHLDSILITHAHRDHVGGLDDIRSFNYVQHCKMEIFCNHEARTAIERDYHYIFAYHEFPGLPEANLHEVSGDEPFEAAGVEVMPVKAMHKDLPILGYRIGKLGYITDANHIEPRELDKLRGVDVLVVNALRKTKHFSHFCLEEALGDEMGLYAEVNGELPEGVQIACDGEKVTIQ